MLQTAQGSLVLLDLHTAAPQVFWNGQKVEHIERIRADWESDDQRIKLTVTAPMPPALLVAMTEAGLLIKEVA